MTNTQRPIAALSGLHVVQRIKEKGKSGELAVAAAIVKTISAFSFFAEKFVTSDRQKFGEDDW